MEIYESLISNFTETLEKQDVLTKLTSKGFLHSYGYSEIHCIDYIGKNEDSNVTKISKYLSLTRGAVSKIVKKLILGGELTSYKGEYNKKEIYYSLTDKGARLFDEHKSRHDKYEKRDTNFYKTIDGGELEIVNNFFKKFNGYLEKQIKEIKER